MSVYLQFVLLSTMHHGACFVLQAYILVERVDRWHVVLVVA
jgi:hypothetical protein